MWKDFFYYSKSERRSILFLSSMGILLLVLGLWSHGSIAMKMPDVDSMTVDSFYVQAYQKHYVKDTVGFYKKKYRCAPVLVDFDPNTADSALFCQLGLPSFLAKRIVNYRAKGGVFRKPADFSRLYGLSDAQFQQLKPYIVIDTLRLKEIQNQRRMLVARRATERGGQKLLADSIYVPAFPVDSSRIKYPEGTVIDLNAADTVQLKHIPGIGSGLAKMIIVYRNRLGGYSSVNQLQEIAHLDTAVNKWFTIETGIYRPLRINRSNLDQLRNHPYMNFYKAKAILEFRRKRGKIKGLSQLSMFQEFTEKDLQRLQPYLDFN